MKQATSLCRDAIERYRAQAFDNIDHKRLRLDTPDDVAWVGRHLIANARSPEAYRAGQAILAALSAARADAG